MLDRFGPTVVIDAALVAAARWGLAIGSLLARAWDWTPFAFPLSGDDLLAAGVAPGPDVGRRLAELRGWWLDGERQADRTALLAELARRLVP